MGDERISQFGHDIELERLAAIVESSDDAIISKSLDGTIRSWNAGATKIFGYTAEEMVGQPITRIVPPELHDQVHEILDRLSRGERIDHFDTVRITKEGRRIDVSLTVSPLRDATGKVVGASKVARDVTERKRAESMQQILIDELNHRVKNTLATVQSIANQTLSDATDPEHFVQSFRGRIQALSRAYDLLVRERMQGISLRNLLETQLLRTDGRHGQQVVLEGPDIVIHGSLAIQMALICHELASGARLHGALSQPDGRLSIRWGLQPDNRNMLDFTWSESGVRRDGEQALSDFGTLLIEKSLATSGSSGRIEPRETGLEVRLALAMPQTGPAPEARRAPAPVNRATPVSEAPSLAGLKVLLIEDEMIVAMDLEMKLEQLGCEVVATAATVGEALDAVSRLSADVALLDANLHGERVEPVARALRDNAIPFVFSTGYGREALPDAFQEEVVLSKPFSDKKFADALAYLAEQARSGGEFARKVELGTGPAE